MNRGVPDIAALPADLREGLDRLAADAVGQFGPLPLAKLVETHFTTVAQMQQSGASWAQVAALFAECGIVGKDGAFSEAVVRATYARAAKARHAASDGRSRRDTAKRNATVRNAARRDAAKRGATKRSARKRVAPKSTATEHDGAERGVAKGDDAKRDGVKHDATGEALARRFSLIDAPWHTR